jgi:hypothetical protein
MKRITIAGVAAVLAAAVAAFIVATGGAAAAPHAKHGTFRQVLASKLGAQLHKPSEDVLAALKAAPPSKSERQARLEARRKGVKPTKADRAKRRDAWTSAMAKSLGVEPSAVTSAVQALVKERLDSLVEDGWLTADQAAKRADKLGIAFLRVGAR